MKQDGHNYLFKWINSQIAPICFARCLFIKLALIENVTFPVGLEISVFPEDHILVEAAKQIVTVFFIILGKIDIIYIMHLDETHVDEIPIIRLIGH